MFQIPLTCICGWEMTNDFADKKWLETVAETMLKINGQGWILA